MGVVLWARAIWVTTDLFLLLLECVWVCLLVVLCAGATLVTLDLVVWVVWAVLVYLLVLVLWAWAVWTTLDLVLGRGGGEGRREVVVVVLILGVLGVVAVLAEMVLIVGGMVVLV